MMIRMFFLLCLLPIFAAQANEPAAASRDLAAAVNAVRLVEKRPLLQLNPQLTAAAQAHARDMATRGYFDHTDPDGRGLPDRLRRTAYPFALALANIAVGQRDPNVVVADWLDHAGNRANLLDRNVRDIGAAHLYYAADPDVPRHRHYWVILLGLKDTGKKQEQANAKH